MREAVMTTLEDRIGGSMDRQARTDLLELNERIEVTRALLAGLERSREDLLSKTLLSMEALDGAAAGVSFTFDNSTSQLLGVHFDHQDAPEFSRMQFPKL